MNNTFHNGDLVGLFKMHTSVLLYSYYIRGQFQGYPKGYPCNAADYSLQSLRLLSRVVKRDPSVTPSIWPKKLIKCQGRFLIAPIPYDPYPHGLVWGAWPQASRLRDLLWGLPRSTVLHLYNLHWESHVISSSEIRRSAALFWKNTRSDPSLLRDWRGQP